MPCRRSVSAALLAVGEQRIDHHVAAEVHPLRWNAFALQVGERAAFGRVQAIGELVGDDAIDLFGHLAVIAAQAGFDMRHRNAFLRCDQRAGHRRIDVAHHQHARRPMAVERRLEPPHHFGGLCGVAARADIEIDVRARQAEVGEKPAAHVLVIVLAGVHEQRRHARPVRRQRTQDRRHLHEIRSRADDADHRPHSGRIRFIAHLLFSSDVVLTAPTSFCNNGVCTLSRSSRSTLRSSRCS